MAQRKSREIRHFDLAFCEIPIEKQLQAVNYQDLLYEYLFLRKKQNDSHVSVEDMFSEILKRQLNKVEALSKEEKLKVIKRGLKNLLTQKKKYEKIRKNTDEEKCFDELLSFFERMRGKIICFAFCIPFFCIRNLYLSYILQYLKICVRIAKV